MMNRVLLGFCVGVNRVLLERGLFREVGVLGSRGVGSCRGMWLGCVIWGREEKKNYFIFDSLGHLG